MIPYSSPPYVTFAKSLIRDAMTESIVKGCASGVCDPLWPQMERLPPFVQLLSFDALLKQVNGVQAAY